MILLQGCATPPPISEGSAVFVNSTHAHMLCRLTFFISILFRDFCVPQHLIKCYPFHHFISLSTTNNCTKKVPTTIEIFDLFSKGHVFRSSLQQDVWLHCRFDIFLRSRQIPSLVVWIILVCFRIIFVLQSVAVVSPCGALCLSQVSPPIWQQ